MFILYRYSTVQYHSLYGTVLSTPYCTVPPSPRSFVPLSTALPYHHCIRVFLVTVRSQFPNFSADRSIRSDPYPSVRACASNGTITKTSHDYVLPWCHTFEYSIILTPTSFYQSLKHGAKLTRLVTVQSYQCRYSTASVYMNAHLSNLYCILQS